MSVKNMNKHMRILSLMCIDAFIVVISLYGALYIRFDWDVPPNYLQSLNKYVVFFTLISLVSFMLFGLYKRVWQYASIGELITIMLAVTVGKTLNITFAFFAVGVENTPFLPRSVLLLSWFMTIFFIGGTRLIWRLYRERKFGGAIKGGKPVVIYGAGDAGVMVAREMKNHFSTQVNVVGFIDDDHAKRGLKLFGLPILGDRDDLVNIVDKYGIERIILAIPSAEGKQIKEVVDVCKETTAELQILPGMFDLIDGTISVNNIREVQIEDLLGRESVKIDLEGITEYTHNKTVLVTGAGGSIGSELCRQIARFDPKLILLLDIYENTIYDLERELKENFPGINIYPLIKDVREKESMENVFKEFKPEVVFHAAAHKHVPLMEHNPEEAIKNNIRGTYNVAQAADKMGVKKFVLISTDKAVSPTSVMGATKRVAEMVIQHMDKVSETSFVAVRFGNVLGSIGSVVPLFKKQIAKGGPVTVTHPDMVRFFMTIPEAVQLVIQAGSMARGGEVFILDMGEPVKIIDLAKSLIKLSGFEPDIDIDIEITGVRPGEKLYEELLIDNDCCDATTHRRIFVEKPNKVDVAMMEGIISDVVTHNLPVNKADSEKYLKDLIPDFREKCAHDLDDCEDGECELEKKKQVEDMDIKISKTSDVMVG